MKGSDRLYTPDKWHTKRGCQGLSKSRGCRGHALSRMVAILDWIPLFGFRFHDVIDAKEGPILLKEIVSFRQSYHVYYVPSIIIGSVVPTMDGHFNWFVTFSCSQETL